MPTLMKKIVSVLFALCVITPAIAQSDVGNWPSQRPIKIIAVFPPGGSVDQVARILAPVLQAELKQNVIVENIGGASGVIGTYLIQKNENQRFRHPSLQPQERQVLCTRRPLQMEELPQSNQPCH